MARVPEGLSPSELRRELSEHAAHSGAGGGERSDRTISIIEAVLLAVVAVLAAWSGYAAAKWSTNSSVLLAQASADRSQANSARVAALNAENFDRTAFSTWFAAYVAQNQTAMAIAEKRFTANFRAAFQAWLATDPENNPSAPPGPTYMPQYRQPEQQKADQLDARATADYNAGVRAGGNGDSYILITVYLATVLFLAGIGGHFWYRSIRYGLATVSTGIVILAVVLLITSPKPPG